MRKYLIIKRFLCLNLIGLCTLVISKESVAKEDPPWKVGIIEEVVVQARLQNSAEELISERMNDEVVILNPAKINWLTRLTAQLFGYLWICSVNPPNCWARV